MVANYAHDSLFCECDEEVIVNAPTSSLYLVTDNTVRAHESLREIIWIEGTVSVAF